MRIIEWFVRLIRIALDYPLFNSASSPESHRPKHPHAVFQRIALEHFHE